MQIFHNTHYDFIKWRWHAMALSAAIIVAGIVMIAQRGLPLGIDFSGGTIVVYHFENKTVTEDAVRKAIESVPGDHKPEGQACGSSGTPTSPAR